MSRLDTCLYKIRQLLFTMLGIYLTVLLLAYPALSLAYASKGLVLWFEKMIPTLLPFMILSGIMIRMHLTHQCVGLFHPLFHRIFHPSVLCTGFRYYMELRLCVFLLTIHTNPVSAAKRR